MTEQTDNNAANAASAANDSDIEDNRANWDDRAEVHFNGAYGDIDALIADSQTLTPVVRRDWRVLEPFLPNGSLTGQRLLHLQCHIGTDTLCWARLGAKDVYGLDFSPVSLRHARDIAARAGQHITYVEGDACKAAEALPGKRFDVIVTSVGTVTWLPKLDGWAQSIADLLAPGGVFMIRDDHPLHFALDDSGLTLGNDYFPGTEDSYDTDQTYHLEVGAEAADDAGAAVGMDVADAAGSAELPDSAAPVELSKATSAARKPHIIHTRNHNWAHDFSEMTQVLLDAGLVLEQLGEYDESDWQSLPMLVLDEATQSWHMPQGYPRVPLTFSLVARKPKD
ncbi:class I SAM-dependent methyltransferase [Bifidobacterium sp. ESL0784]|uniref:class I SAM-dependent methyltransferase n=1 Tax=Bifidobacterium sp. ESL0784 TaxID=2983231 RepID=UPI0023F8864C|nr:class I SAM-dependent methyltransferase [Bifidobacterium sp. ESL0784]MDF7640040.1 class I SAM-dependent methyltransferase [Bifidobacterium sp. ESL0784]